MQFGLDWLKDYLAEVPDAGLLENELPLAGFEVESLRTAGGDFSGVVVASIVEAKQHPNADRLRLCRVDDGEQQYDIVCGAPNARAGIKVALSRVGALLPGNFKIKRSKIRGEISEGMLCSESELGISQEHEGIIELPDDAEPGADVHQLLALDEQIIDLDITPNRGDCLSVRGIAREIAAISGSRFAERAVNSVDSDRPEHKEVQLDAGDACPRYAGRVLRLTTKGATSPQWIQRRLVRAGLRPISLVVDITNFVMLDLGQPMHAFDYHKLSGSIRVRWARSGESLMLLNQQEIELSDKTLVIADDSGPIALAGIMGGASTEIDDSSEYIFLEAAHFSADAVAGRARSFGLHTDASMRFERGVDWQLPPVAIEMATELLVQYGKAEVAPLSDVLDRDRLPRPQVIECSMERFNQLAGIEFDARQVDSHLLSLGMQLDAGSGSDFVVTTPSWRYDLERPEDIFEETLRLHGYSEVPENLPQFTRPSDFGSDSRLNQFRLFDHLAGMGYQEVLSYSFINHAAQIEFMGEGEQTIELENPISADLAHMRSSLIPSLLGVITSNLRRQHPDLRIFETGLCFRAIGDAIEQNTVLAMAVCGNNHRNHWREQDSSPDVFCLKGHIESLLALTHSASDVRFVATQVRGLHPGQSVAVLVENKEIGVFGKVHPKTAKNLGLDGQDVFVAELDLNALSNYARPEYQAVSVYPGVYRDLAVIVSKEVQWQTVRDYIAQAADDQLVEIALFDLYQHRDLGEDRKSFAFKLCWQSATQTLTDSYVSEQIDAILVKLKSEIKATLR